jgi:hypothetical protein
MKRDTQNNDIVEWYNSGMLLCCVFYADFVYAEFRIFALYAECHNAECRLTECRYDEFRILALCTECHYDEFRILTLCVIILSVVMLSPVAQLKKLGIMRSRIYYFTEKYLACLSSNWYLQIRLVRL